MSAVEEVTTPSLSDLTRTDLTNIAKSLHRTRKDLERSRKNAEKRGIAGIVDSIDSRSDAVDALIAKVDGINEQLRKDRDALARRRRKDRKRAEKMSGKDAVALAVYELKVFAERARRIVAIDGYVMEDDVLRDMIRVRKVSGGALFDHGRLTGRIVVDEDGQFVRGEED